MNKEQSSRNKFNTIIINHKNGATTTWDSDQWDEYTYTDHNMDCVDNIVVTSTN